MKGDHGTIVRLKEVCGRRKKRKKRESKSKPKDDAPQLQAWGIKIIKKNPITLFGSKTTETLSVSCG